ncbi:MAG TPA: divalent-cation tolerance protein CutA [Luteimonas sp.]
MTVLLCHCTCPDEDTATAIADALVAERLAACVSLQPGLTSIYRWQGRVERAREVLLAIKTTRARLPALVERIRALHPHELPEVLAFEAAGGLEPWLRWVESEAAPAPE